VKAASWSASEPASRGLAYEPGDFCWVGLATADPAAARSFYGTLFGWEGENLNAGEVGDYCLLRLHDRAVAVLYSQTPQARRAGALPHWTCYVSVEDADATAARAGELGGAAVFREPFDVLDEGRVAAIRDPLGAILSLWQPRARSGAALVDEVGALCWIELTTKDLERCSSFYGDLLGWRYQIGSAQISITNRGRANGGMRLQSEPEQDTPPTWFPYFMVDDIDRAADTAERAGGRDLAPRTVSDLGRSAILADPQGAKFGVLERDQSP
jgi:predicted enzyme related to lactoylglutathione lyase